MRSGFIAAVISGVILSLRAAYLCREDPVRVDSDHGEAAGKTETQRDTESSFTTDAVLQRSLFRMTSLDLGRKKACRRKKSIKLELLPVARRAKRADFRLPCSCKTNTKEEKKPDSGKNTNNTKHESHESPPKQKNHKKR